MKLDEYKKTVGRTNRRVEGDVSKTIAAYLDLKGIWHIRLQSGKVQVVSEYKGRTHSRWIHFGHKGCPDRLALINGKSVFIEVKKPGAKPTDDQLAEHRRIEANGGIVIVADSLDEFKKRLSEI
jgi:hypothetical protein